ncbi:DUF4097 family beta strand repeat-containing protein [Streptosporangium sandarakinum]|uniref:DUF4097 domain-containing protein n=1 Tax=Streptosporangium sandarakinum TaxID=1260955 RepID=A0A852V7F6_9ACTN|nr:DUF4097 family beta strand repeat-containing protein [Streptosporangium sandarakinum]NYF41975.1 hypothetical protein [Streptosporangium sandarakinum]
MPSFPAPGPVTLRVKLPAGLLEVTAAPREDAVVEVRPSRPSSSADAEAASRTRVERLDDGTILVETPEQRAMLGRRASVDVLVALPAGSAVALDAASADVRASGPLGDVAVGSASGDVRIERCARLDVRTASGDVTCDVIGAEAGVQTSSGDIRLRELRGEAEITTSSGDVRLGAAHGDTTVRSGSGDITVETSAASFRTRSTSGEVTVGTAGDLVEVHSSSGDVEVGAVTRGRVSVDSVSGDVRIGVADGVSAWLDVSTVSGDLRSGLEEADRPGDEAPRTEIRVKTVSGDISLVRTRP